MNKPNKIAAALSVALAMTSGLGLAQSSGPVKPQYQIPTGKAPADGPMGIQLDEGIYAFPYVNVGLGRDDNLFLANTNKKSSSIGLLNLGAVIEARRPSSLYKLGLDAVAVRYHNSTPDDYRDYRAFGSGEFAFSSSAGLRLGLESNSLHDPRGSTDRIVSARPDRYTNEGANALFAFGGNEAKGRVELAGGSYRKRYDSNRLFTQFSDRDTDNIRGTFFWRVMPKTSMLVEASEIDYRYTTQSSPPLDSKEHRYMAGVTWEATAATTGTIKIGNLKKDFQSSGRKNFSGTNWEAAVQWAPLTYSKFDIFTQKTINESTGVGDFVLTKRSGVAWTHGWDSRLSSTASYARTDDEFLGAGASRDDKTDSLGFKVNYKVQRWLTLGADYTYTNRDSNQSVFSYKRNYLMFTAGATL